MPIPRVGIVICVPLPSPHTHTPDGIFALMVGRWIRLLSGTTGYTVCMQSLLAGAIANLEIDIGYESE